MTRIPSLAERGGRPRSARRACLLAFLAILLLRLAAFSACSTAKVESQGVRAEGVPVTVATAVQKTVPVELRAVGNVEAYSQVSVKAQVEGQLDRVHFREGQDVKAGDLLYTLDARPFEAALKQAEGNLARDVAQAKHAREEAQRFATLAEEGVVSKEQYDHSRSSADAFDASVRSDKAAVENAQVQLGYCTIRSPIDGRTGSLIVHPGNVVKANEVTLVVINQVKPIYVNFSVPEKYLSEIKGHMAAGPLRVGATIPGEEKRLLQGVLTFVDNAVEITTGTIHLKGTFANSERRLWPGQFVNVALTLASQRDATVVPSEAVQTGQQGQYVFVLKPDLTAEPRPVVIGRALEGETVIEQGIRPGEKVVTDGQLRLSPGARVEIKAGP